MLYVLGVQLDAETDIMYARMAVNLPQNPSRWFGRLSELTRVLILPSSHSWFDFHVPHLLAFLTRSQGLR